MNLENQLSFICPGTSGETRLWFSERFQGIDEHAGPGYICLQLREEWLDKYTFRRISSLGVECLAEGGPYLAYGIGQLDDELWERLMEDPAVVSVEAGEPPSGK